MFQTLPNRGFPLLRRNLDAFFGFDVRMCVGSRASGRAGDRAGGRFWEVSRLWRSMGSKRPAEQLAPAWRSAAADAGISKGAGQECGRPARRQAWQLAIDLLHARGHAGADELYNPMEVVITPETTYII